MAARITTERILRDDDDANGQSCRDWTIESEGGIVKIRLKHGDGFVLMRAADVPIFMADMDRARALAIELDIAEKGARKTMT